MSWKTEWRTVFFPEFDSGGLSLTRDQVATRIFEDAESPATTATLSTAWTGTNVTITRETTSPLAGEGSVKCVVAGGAGSAYKSLDRAKFGYPFPGHSGIRFRYLKFRMTCDSGQETVRVTFGDVSDANHYKYWNVVVAQDNTTEYVIDLDPDNTESYPAPTATGATAWDPEQIDRIGFTNLTSGRTFYWDDIDLVYEYYLPDIIGFGTEAPVDMGDVGSLHAKINGMWANVKALEGQTHQYTKQGIAETEVGQSISWALEMLTDFAPPTTTEITPGNYTINRVRHGTTTEIVASTLASESAGTIYASYTPQEDNWAEGDLIKTTFSGGYIETDEEPTETLTANANSGQAVVTVDNAFQWQVGWRVRIYDDTPDTEYATISSITSPTQITLGGNLSNSYTTAANAGMTRVIQTELTTAVFFTRVSREPTAEEYGKDFEIADHDEADVADATADTERWTSEIYTGAAEASLSDINTTVAGKIYLLADPDVTPTGTGIAVRRNQAILTKYCSLLVDATITWGSIEASVSTVGMQVSKGSSYDVNNCVYLLRRRNSVPNNQIVFSGYFDAAPTVDKTAAITDDALAFKIERIGNIWRGYYSTTQYPDYQWVLVGELEDINGDLTGNTSVFLTAYSGGTVDGQTVQGDYDNFVYVVNAGAFLEQMYGSQVLATGKFTTSSATVPADTGRTEANDYWSGSWLLPLDGSVVNQPRLIVDFANAGGVFTVDSEQPFTAATGTVEYAILSPNSQLVPAADSNNNQTPAHVIGNKSDVADVADGQASVIGRLRGLEAALSVNAAAGGEFEIDGDPDLWDALVNNSSADASITTLTGNRDAAVMQRLAALVNSLQITDAGTATGFEEDGTGGALWESLVAVKGTFTTSSTTVPADTGRTEANDYFNGDIIVPLSGDIVRQARVIVDFANTGGVFTLDPQNPFTAAPGLVTYVILHFAYPLVPAADASSNSTSAHVVGNKSDAIPAMNLAPGTDSAIAHLKAILERLGATPADPDDSVLTILGQRDDSVTVAATASVVSLLRDLIAAMGVVASGAGGGFEVDGTPALPSALGTTGSVVTDSATSVLGAIGADNADNAFASTNIAANSDGSVLERLEHILVALGGTTGITSALGTTSTAIDTVSRVEVNDYWNGGIFICVDGTNKGLARPIYDFVNASGTVYFEPAFPNAVASGVNYLILTRFDVARIVGDNNANNAYASDLIVANEDGSLLEREEDIVRKMDVPGADAATNVVARDVVGNKSDTIPAMNLTPGATDSIVRHLKAILERIGETPADPDDSVLTNVGQRDDAATNDSMADITTTSVQAKLRLILNRMSSDAFSATVQGVARTELDTMLAQLATYLSASGAAWSVQINNNTARTNLEQVIEDLSAVLGCDNANVFNPSIGGSARTDLDAALAAVGTALGAEYDGSPDIYDTIITGHDSSAITANVDGSVEERLEDIRLAVSRAEYQLADFDNFDVADADANNERWDVGYINGTEGGSADISTTTAGKLMAKVDPDVTPTAASYGVHLAQPIVSKYFVAIVDVNSTFGTPSGSWASAGMRISPTAYDSNNVVYIQRQNSSGGVLDRLAAGAIFGGANQGEVYFTTSDAAVAFKIERLDNVWRLYYSLAQYPDYVWVLLTQYEDASENMDSQQSVYLDAYTPGSADAETAQGDFDNFKLYLILNGLSQEIAGDYDSSVVAADEDGSIAERLEQVQEAVNRGSGTSLAANKSLVDALGTDGTTVADSAVSVLGAIGADNADNAFDSSTVASNANGSVLEREEYIQVELAKVPKSDGAVSWNATALGDIQTQADDALVARSLDNLLETTDGAGNFPNTAIDGSVVSKIISKVAGGDTSSYDETTDSLEAISDKLGTSADAAGTSSLFALAQKRLAGRTQIFEVAVTSAANAGNVTLATVTTQPCLIKSIVVKSNGVTTADLTSAAVYGGASAVVTFIDTTLGAVANINADDEQVAWDGSARFAATKTIIMTLTGTGATAVDLTVTIEFMACADGGYLA